MSTTGKHALIFGASGISGWSLLNQTLSYPTLSTFRKVTGLCNRPLSKSDLFIADDERLNLYSGIDLTKPVEEVIAQLKVEVEEIETVDIVFYCALVNNKDAHSLVSANTALLRTAILAISSVAPNLEAVILQTGGKGYGLQYPEELSIKPPLHEDMPRIPKPWSETVFYYTQYDLLMELSKTHKWTFSEIRPDGIVGFAPGWNAMNMAYGIAFYLTLFRGVYGVGATVPFPGKEHGYYATHSDTFQDILSKMEIFAALNQDKCPNGSSFNVADGETVSWARVWPGLCAYFGLVGSEPRDDQMAVEPFMRQHQGVWDQLVEAQGLRKGSIEEHNWGFNHFMLVDFDFNREYSLDKARAVGFEESIDTVQGYRVVFDRMVRAKLIPGSAGSGL